jgi:hypothetical protein
MSVATTSVLPPTKALRDLLLDLMQKGIDIKPGKPWAVTPEKPGAVALYVDDHTKLKALVFCDLDLAAHLGACIGLVPAGGAKACIEDGALSETISDNLYEVFNIVSALFNVPDHPHLKLYGVHDPGEALPADVAAHCKAMGMRDDVVVSIAGYGSGTLSIVLV